MRGTASGRICRYAFNLYCLKYPSSYCLLEVTEDTYSILHGLLSSIPTFWDVGELNQVLTLYIDHCVSTANTPSSPMSTLMKAVTKRASSTSLLPVMVEMWTMLRISPDLVCFSSTRAIAQLIHSFDRIGSPLILMC